MSATNLLLRFALERIAYMTDRDGNPLDMHRDDLRGIARTALAGLAEHETMICFNCKCGRSAHAIQEDYQCPDGRATYWAPVPLRGAA